MSGEKNCFVAVEFPEDPNVAGYYYWYLCADKSAIVGDCVLAPLGRHNREQEGIIRKVLFAYDEEAPYPIYAIKSIRKIIREE